LRGKDTLLIGIKNHPDKIAINYHPDDTSLQK